MKRRRSSPVIAVAWGVLAVLAAVALAAPWLASADPTRQNLRGRLAAPQLSLESSWREGVFGRDHLGRDLQARTLHGLRTSLALALAGTAIGLVVGTALGIASGLAGGRIDEAIMFAVDVQAALPFVLVVLVTIAVFGTSPLVLIAVIGLAGWETYARVVRGEVQAARRRPYVEASRALGANDGRIALRHLLPNVSTPVITLASVNFSAIILLESALSFLGLGIQPPAMSLGLLIATGREYLLTAPWMAIYPSLFLVTLTLSVGLIADDLRDRLDPHGR